jgi:hypothetical protein
LLKSLLLKHKISDLFRVICGTGGDDGDSRESLRIIFPAGSRSFSGWPTNKELPGNNRGFVSVMHWQSAVWSSDIRPRQAHHFTLKRV